ncbi:shikimate kinase [Parvibaculum sp.]|jgi:shikimate kinase|uniref:shikimate kinase n=1 Tax=Parvibaculum sp. TaxID=2024848 RepID=UPI0025F7AF8A|nr:shikimate kinase [Parvibaculum sp.]|tara:strand:- start:335 stop:970 length:636 start_codon:yes stop_codon:yes gene_type:complete
MMKPGDQKEPDERLDERDENEALSPVPFAERSIVLVGLMGAGKTTVGRRLARRLDLAFVDTDAEIEQAAGETIPEIFERRGEATFRAGERRVIARLLGEGPRVLATGGGAFMDPLTRANIAARGISVWLKADLDVLMKRVGKRGDRPLLQTDDPRETMKRLMDQRYPVYAEADITIESLEGPHDAVVDEVMEKLTRFRAEHAAEANAGGRE